MSNIDTLIEKHIGNKEVFKVPAKGKYLETTIPPEKRTLENIPKYTNESNKVDYESWLGLSKEPELWPKLRNVNWGWSKNGCCYGYSKRSIEEFYTGKKVRRDSIGNDRNKEFIIESDEEAEEMAKKFSKEIS